MRKKKNLISLLGLAMTLLLAFFAPQYFQKDDSDLRYYQIDVGQGDAALFIFPDGKTMLVDSGTKKASASLSAFLKKQGVSRIDLLVATHPHPDHIGGMKRIISDFEIGQVWDSGFLTGSQYLKTFYKMVKRKKIPFRCPKRGYKEEFGGGIIEVLAPAKELRGTRSDPNNNCIVFKMAYNDVSFLMTGDMEEEERISISPLPEASVLKIAHHGSVSGTDIRMLRQVAPKMAVISYETGNPYGFPHREVVRDIRRMHIIRFDTAQGTVALRTDGEKITYQNNRVVK